MGCPYAQMFIDRCPLAPAPPVLLLVVKMVIIPERKVGKKV